jgi:hypothetical protein
VNGRAQEVAISVRPARVAGVLALVTAGLGAAHTALVYAHNGLGVDVERVLTVFDLSQEKNVPTLFSSAMLLSSAGLLAVVGCVQKRAGGAFTRHWTALAFIFLFLSLDELARVHERLILPLRHAFHFSGVLHYAWVLPYGMAVGVFALAYARFVLALPRTTRRLFLSAAFLYVGGALGVEAIEGPVVEAHGEHHPFFLTLSTAEELLEMTGLVVFVYGLLSHIAQNERDVRVVLTVARSSPPR